MAAAVETFLGGGPLPGGPGTRSAAEAEGVIGLAIRDVVRVVGSVDFRIVGAVEGTPAIE